MVTWVHGSKQGILVVNNYQDMGHAHDWDKPLQTEGPLYFYNCSEIRWCSSLLGYAGQNVKPLKHGSNYTKSYTMKRIFCFLKTWKQQIGLMLKDNSEKVFKVVIFTQPNSLTALTKYIEYWTTASPDRVRNMSRNSSFGTDFLWVEYRTHSILKQITAS